MAGRVLPALLAMLERGKLSCARRAGVRVGLGCPSCWRNVPPGILGEGFLDCCACMELYGVCAACRKPPGGCDYATPVRRPPPAPDRVAAARFAPQTQLAGGRL